MKNRHTISRWRSPRARAGLRRPLSAALLAFGLALPSAAGAQQPAAPAASSSSPAQRETARAWVREGRALFAQKDYAAALERFSAAYQLVRVPTVGIEVARTQAALGKWAEANASAVEVVNLPRAAAEPEVFAAARDQARDLLRDLSPRMPALQLQITPSEADVQVQIDGEELPRAAIAMPLKVNPGQHRLRVSAPGFQVAEQSFVLAERERRTLALELAVDARAPSGAADQLPSEASPGAAPQAAAGSGPMGAAPEPLSDGSGARTRGYVALGVGGVAALVGGVSGVLAFRSVPDCPNHRCAPDQRDAADRSRAYGNVATVSFGVAALAGGYALWELLANAAPSADSARRAPSSSGPELVPRQGGAALQLSGKF